MARVSREHISGDGIRKYPAAFPERDERITRPSGKRPFLRRTKNVEELLPWLYLKGVSTGQFEEALTALLGPDAPGLSASTVRRLMATWQQEYERWQRRDLRARRYVYVWADGVYFTPRVDHERQCISWSSSATSR